MSSRIQGGARRVLNTVSRIMAEEGDTEQLRLRKSIALVALGIGVPLTALSALSAYLSEEPTRVVQLLAGLTLLLLVLLPALLLFSRYVDVIFVVTMTANLVVTALITYVHGGISLAAANPLWALITPVLALLMYGRRVATWFFVAYLAVLVWSTVILDDPSLDANQESAFATVLIGVSIFVFAMFLYFTAERDRAQRIADDLLHNVLPDPIVTRLKSGESPIADAVPGASVLFADIADFTPLSSTLTPDELVELLGQVFSAFDRLAARHGVEKIKTIGDAYMVAAGVPAPRSDHARVLADMALDMRALMVEQRFGDHQLRFRIGISSGPLTAGVIGEQKFIYDLWGDTVNTASRMESHGVAGEIQVTPDTANLLRDRYELQPRGVVDVKGKGPMETWLLVGRR